MNQMLKHAMKHQYAIPQFNMNGLSWLRAILNTAEKKQAPVIIGTTDKIADQLGGFRLLAQSFQTMKEELNISVPTILHLDHGQSVDRCLEAVDAGYDSVMYDGSKMSIDENIINTKKVVEYAHSKDVTVEAEVGSVGGTEDGIYSDMLYADLNECARLVQESGADNLAPALGSVHGKYRGEPNLGFREMEELRRKISYVPFVLHGASGISDADLKKAIEFGHCKINYNTELNIAWAEATRNLLIEDKQVFAPMDIMRPGEQAIEKVVENILERTGAADMAELSMEK